MRGIKSPSLEVRKVVLLLAIVLFAGSVWSYVTTVPVVSPVTLPDIQKTINETIESKIPYIAKKVIEIIEQKGYVLLTEEEYNKIKKDIYVLKTKVSVLEENIGKTYIDKEALMKKAEILGNVYYLCEIVEKEKVATGYVDKKPITCKAYGVNCICGYKLDDNKILVLEYNKREDKLESYTVEKLE